MKVSFYDYLEACQKWKFSGANKTMRLGQYLMNNLVPLEVNPRIFYEENANLAGNLFQLEYVE